MMNKSGSTHQTVKGTTMFDNDVTADTEHFLPIAADVKRGDQITKIGFYEFSEPLEVTDVYHDVSAVVVQYSNGWHTRVTRDKRIETTPPF